MLLSSIGLYSREFIVALITFFFFCFTSDIEYEKCLARGCNNNAMFGECVENPMRRMKLRWQVIH